MIASLVLYGSPLLPRLVDGGTPWRVLLSLVPLPVVFPSILLPRFIRDPEREHVARHALYAFSFTLSAATSVRWDVVSEAFDEEWALPLILYLCVGAASLWWFAVSHVLENGPFPTLFTHQGDVAVLPLTLVAIATFVRDVPDEAFQHFRSVIFYVPVIIAWATLHFVAFNGFATSRTTTYDVVGFGPLALSGQIIGAAHLALIEMRASPNPFLFFPLVAALLSQVTPRPACPPVLRAWRLPGELAIALSTAVPFGFLFDRKFPTAWSFPTLAAIGVVTLPSSVGNAWPLPAAAYATLLAAANARVSLVGDVVALFGAFFICFRLTHILAPPEEDQRTIPPCAAPSNAASTPQDKSSFSLSRLMRPCSRIPVCARHTYNDALVRKLLERRTAECPEAFAGVWWMRGNSFPMHLTCVHGHAWRRRDDAYTTSFWMNEGTTRPATVAGVMNRVGQSWCTMRVEWNRGDAWVRTPGWFVGRTLPSTYWLYRVSEDEMLRIVCDADGTIVWQYRMLRIARGDGTHTTHYRTFMQLYRGTPCLLD